MSHLNDLTGVMTTPQSEPLDSRQVANDAGGYVYAAADIARLERFIVLGTEGGTFYVAERQHTIDNAKHAAAMIRARGTDVVRTVVAIAYEGRAPKKDTGIFVLALCAAYGDDATRRDAFAALPRVCSTHRMLFTFLNYVEQHRGWGRALRQAIAQWYLDKTVDAMAFQLVKYRQGTFARGDGPSRIWNARNAMRVAHPVTDEPARRALIDWAMGRPDAAAIASFDSLRLVAAFEEAWSGTVGRARRLELASILTHEMLPDEWKADPDVWAALLERMPMTAMTRNLGNMTRVGLLAPGSDAARTVAERLTDRERIRKARVHPAQFLTALGSYGRGGRTGRSSGAAYIPAPEVVGALDAAFYLAFPNVRPAAKRTLIGLDVSGSMSSESSASGVTCKDAAAALALVQVATEPNVAVLGFSSPGNGKLGGRFDSERSGLTPIPAKPGHRIADVVALMEAIPMGGTDCALPMLHATENDLKVDTFQIYTDNETWAGSVHPMEALRRYRNHSGIDARLVVCALTASPFTIADPNDAGSLDVVGFDTAVPTLIADFSRGATAPETSDAAAQ
jgi:60 kDa SS-A/Ro ribonucleoprotein